VSAVFIGATFGEFGLHLLGAQTMLPIQPGRPERRIHDYRRHGTITLFAALEIATGKVTGGLQAAAGVPGLPQTGRSRLPERELHLVWTTTSLTNASRSETGRRRTHGSRCTSHPPQAPG
jgi:hypothetical protein